MAINFNLQNWILHGHVTFYLALTMGAYTLLHPVLEGGPFVLPTMWMKEMKGKPTNNGKPQAETIKKIVEPLLTTLHAMHGFIVLVSARISQDQQHCNMEEADTGNFEVIQNILHQHKEEEESDNQSDDKPDDKFDDESNDTK